VFFFQAEDSIRAFHVTGVQTCALPISTLGVQYYLNLVTQQENNDLRKAQAQALVAGITLGFKSITLTDIRVKDLVNDPGETYYEIGRASCRERVDSSDALAVVEQRSQE